MRRVTVGVRDVCEMSSRSRGNGHATDDDDDWTEDVKFQSSVVGGCRSIKHCS